MKASASKAAAPYKQSTAAREAEDPTRTEEHEVPAQAIEAAREPEAAAQVARATDDAARGRARAATPRTATIIGMPAVVAAGGGALHGSAERADEGEAEGEPGRWWPSAPLTLGRFQFDQELALGPYGASYAGREVEGGAASGRGNKAPGAVHAALFHPALFADGAKKKAQRARIDRALRYESPYVAPTYAVGEAYGTVYAVTAPVFGVPLTHWRREVGALGAEETYRITGQLLDAMEAIHAQGGVHGGLSPETLRIVQDRVWVTSPWWLDAAEVPDGEVQPQRTAWLAPELLFGEPAESATTDVYGVGLTLGYLLARGLTEPGHSLLVQGIDVAPELDDVYVRATARQKEARYPDVASLRAALAAAGGVEWRDAQMKTLRAARKGGLAAVEVLDVKPRTRPPERRPTGPELMAVPVVARAEPPPPPREVTRAELHEDDEAILPEPPPIVPTESVLAAVVGRSALGDLERTVEDTVRPVFDEEPREEEHVSGLLRLGVEPGGPISRRSQRVTPRTLLHGTPKPSSGVVAASEVPIDQAARPAAGVTAPPTFDATDGLPAHYLTDELFRQLTEGLESPRTPPLGAGGQPAVAGSIDGKTPVRPPPLPGETRPRWQARSSWGSTLEALDVGGPAPAPGSGGAERPLPAREPPAAPAPPPLAPAEVATAAERAAPIAEVSPPALPPSALTPAPLELVDSPEEGATIPSEPTVIEGIAPALLEVDVFNAYPLAPLPAPPIDPLAAAPEPPPNPWSDSPLVVSPPARAATELAPPPPPISATVGIAELLAGVGLGDEADVAPPAEAAPLVGPGSRAEPRPKALTTPPSGVPMVAAAAGGAVLDSPIVRGPVTRPRDARPEAGAARVPTTRAEPRILRDPSGPLAGASASLAGIPIRPTGHVPTITTGRPIAETAHKRRPRTLLLAALALAVGVAVALAVIALGGRTGSDAGGGRELASVGHGVLGEGATTERKSSGGEGSGEAVALVASEPEPDVRGADGSGPAEAGGGEDALGSLALGGDSGEESSAAGDEDAGEGAMDVTALAGVAEVGPLGEVADAALAASLVPAPGEASAPPVGNDAAVADGQSVDTAVGPDAGPVHAEEAAQEDVEDAVALDAVKAEDSAGQPETADAREQVVFTPKDPNKLKCPDGMLKLKRKVAVTLGDGRKVDDWDVGCIDRFEFPGAGAVPRTNVDLGQARAACAQKGKRLCTRSEWRRACGGTYPYGKEYDATRCNTAGDDGTPRALVGAGTKKGCMSPSGAFDMVGNAAEWTSDGTINGGAAQRNAADATCGSASKRIGGAPHIGFRCCVDAKE